MIQPLPSYLRKRRPAPPARCTWDLPGEECTAPPTRCITATTLGQRHDTWLCDHHADLHAATFVGAVAYESVPDA